MSTGLLVILGFMALGVVWCGYGLWESSRARYAPEGVAIVMLLIIPGGFVAACSFVALFLWALLT